MNSFCVILKETGDKVIDGRGLWFSIGQIIVLEAVPGRYKVIEVITSIHADGSTYSTVYVRIF